MVRRSNQVCLVSYPEFASSTHILFSPAQPPCTDFLEKYFSSSNHLVLFPAQPPCMDRPLSTSPARRPATLSPAAPSLGWSVLGAPANQETARVTTARSPAWSSAWTRTATLVQRPRVRISLHQQTQPRAARSATSATPVREAQRARDTGPAITLVSLLKMTSTGVNVLSVLLSSMLRSARKSAKLGDQEAEIGRVSYLLSFWWQTALHFLWKSTFLGVKC